MSSESPVNAKLPRDWEIRNNPDGSLDEVVGTGFFHLEQMADGSWWMALYDSNKRNARRIVVWLQTRRGAQILGRADYEDIS